MKKQKFKSAEEKRRFLENQKSWDELKAKYATTRVLPKRSEVLSYSLENPAGRERMDLPSRVTSGGSTARRDSMMYSGDKIMGIGMMHKSNLVPVFKDQDAKDLASMRR